MPHLCTLLLALFLLPNLGLAQNLVPNPGFEDTLSCPLNDGDVHALDHWFAAKWSPDYFNPCASAYSYVSVPGNFPGYQIPYGGNAYAGFYTYSFTDQSNTYREILGTALTEPLKIGVEYFVSAFVSKGNANSGFGNFDCATDKIGFRFSTTRHEAFTQHDAPVDNFAHVYTTTIITDTLNWRMISGSFIADSNYTYLNVGNFFDYGHTSTNACTGDAYYYIDNVCVSTHPNTCEVINGLSYPYKPARITLFPNPAQNTLSLQHLTGQNRFAIFSATGTTVKTGTLTETENAADVSALPNGLLPAAKRAADI